MGVVVLVCVSEGVCLEVQNASEELMRPGSHLHTQVKKEYRILTKLPRGAAPEPLFCSTADEEAITGTEFMVMTFIEVSGILLV